MQSTRAQSCICYSALFMIIVHIIHDNKCNLVKFVLFT